MIKIAIVDDHSLYRKSLRMLISPIENTEIVLEAESGRIILEKLQTSAVDLILLDLQMPVMDGFTACSVIRERYPHIRIIALSQFKDLESIRKMIHLGVIGYFTKDSDPDELRQAIKNSHTAAFHFEKKLSPLFETLGLFSKSTFKSVISKRQKEIICLSAKGLSSKEIASILFISPRTVDEHKRNLIKSLNCPNFTLVILYALKNKHICYEDIEN